MIEGQLKGLIPRTRELGRLRTGEKGTKTNARGKEVSYPVKRTTWRLTSPSPDLLARAAELYGGGVEIWADAPTQGRQYQLSTECEALDVMIPLTDNVISQAFELWSGGGCKRRCDGERMSDDSSCVCPADIEARMKAASPAPGEGPPTACKPYTRFNVLLPEIPDLGFWRLETHGYNAAVELPGSLALYAGLARQMIAGDAMTIVRAQLTIESRSSVKDGQTRHYTVPVIRTPNVTPAALFGGHQAPALPSAGHAQDEGADALTTTEAQPAPPPLPAAPPSTDPFDAFVSETWLAAFAQRVNDAGLGAEDIAEVVMAGTASRTAVPGQIHKTETAAVKRALEMWLGSGYDAPAEATA